MKEYASLSRYVMIDVTQSGSILQLRSGLRERLMIRQIRESSIAEGFLATDGILDLCMNVTNGLVVYDKVITKHLMAELPFMATENIMMDARKSRR